MALTSRFHDETLSLRHLPEDMLDTLSLWHRRAVERHQMALLSERDVRDLGATPAQIQFEMNKPFWRA